MKAALLAKVKAAGPVAHPRQEIARLQLWWPKGLYPVARRLSYWTERFAQALAVSERLAIEEQALADLVLRLKRADTGVDAELVLQFVQRVMQVVQESRAARVRAREGTPLPLDLEEARARELREWLRRRARQPAQMAVASALLRLLEAWTGVRWHTQTPVS